MFEEYSPPIPVARLLVRNGFGNDVGSVEAVPSNDIQEITLLDDCLMWNDAAVYGGRIWLEFFVSVWYDLWESCVRESAMIFMFP